MRLSVLDLLKNASDYISGEEIAKRLNVSRTAVWKHIKELKATGYMIESHSRNGYRLLESPDLLLPNEVAAQLKTKWLGREIRYYSSIDSTNRAAKSFDDEGLSEGAVAVSEEQTGGKGRLARGWFSPAQKGIWFSVMLKPKFLPQEAPKCTLLAAVAIVKAIENAAGVKCGIKWPNDILYDGKKLVGILTEMSATMEGINYIVIGMGINVNLTADEYPDDLKNIGISLKMITGKDIDRRKLFAEILLQLEILYEAALEKGFASILQEWRKCSITLGQEVNVIGVNETFFGRAADIDEDGALMVDTGESLVKVLAGDVSIRPKK
jgi:BirA family biotin operon repressor/biotin-[acetyl-CoA-carboxylase] ligase